MASRSLIPLLVAMMLLTGVCNTLLTKYQDMQCVGDCNTKRPRTFEQPVLQTLQMFVGEAGCWLVVFASWLLTRVKAVRGGREARYTPIADAQEEEEGEADEDPRLSSSQTLIDPTNLPAKPLIDGEEGDTQRKPLKGLRVLLLALPAVCDICGTTLMNAGLLFVAASIYQMTRGALVLFVGLFSVIFLKRHLGPWKWASLFVVVAGVGVVGLAGALEHKDGASSLPHGTHHRLSDSAKLLVRKALSSQAAHTAGETIIGVLMIAGAQIFTASQFVLEESIMEHYSMDPIQVVGWEGVFGFIVTLIGMGVLHLAIGRTPRGRGGYFDAHQGFKEMFNNRAIAVTSVLIMISIGGFNFFGLSVTRQISATARSTIDTCRTLFIWLVSLGLGWETFKWLQVLGSVLLVWATGVFNDLIKPPSLAFLRRRRTQGGSVALPE